jgi:hypothetical protein
MPKARGRPAGFTMSNDHRVKIQNSNILNALIEHAEGKRDMSATQVSAGLGLLRKVMADQAATTVSGPEGGAIEINVTIGGNAGQP